MTYGRLNLLKVIIITYENFFNWCLWIYRFAIIQILKKKNNLIYCKSLQEFILEPSKGINISGSIYSDKLQKKILLKLTKHGKNANELKKTIKFILERSF